MIGKLFVETHIYKQLHSLLPRMFLHSDQDSFLCGNIGNNSAPAIVIMISWVLPLTKNYYEI